MEALVVMDRIRKEFPGVVALQNVSFDIRPGEVHLLLGENGAGKSTLMKILSGIYTPTSGTITFGNDKYEKITPDLAKEKGISVIYQELSVVNELSIAENMFIGNLPRKKLLNVLSVVDKKQYIKRAEEMAKRVGLTKPVTTLVGDLSISEKQMVEIAKALMRNARILVMDEPTSSLEKKEVKRLVSIIDQLKKDGIGIVYITHKMDELKDVGDRVTVLKDGQTVGTKYMKDISGQDEIVRMMVGREVNTKFFSEQPVDYSKNDIVMSVKNIVRRDGKTKNISFDLHRGEVLGFAGLVGCGRTELMNAIFAGESFKSGEVTINGEKIRIKTPYQSIKNGVAMINENRREAGIFPNFAIRENLVLVNRLLQSKVGGFIGLVHPHKDQKLAQEQREARQVKCANLDQLITDLSGGNQQKVIVGRWMASEAKVIIFDEPTKGIDIATKAEMYAIMRKLAESGIGVIMVSSEMPELLGVCDRIAVLNDGQLKKILPIAEATEESILNAAIGTEEKSKAAV